MHACTSVCPRDAEGWEKDGRPEMDNPDTREMRWEVNAETCGFRSAKAWLEINRRVQSAPTHRDPAPRQVTAERGWGWRGKGDARFLFPVVIPSLGISSSLFAVVRATGWGSL